MRIVFFLTLVFSVASVFSQQPFARYSENLRKAVPPHYNHDQKNTHRGLDKVARWHKVEPRQPPLRPEPEVPWLRWVHEGRYAAQADKNTELLKVRAHLLAEKLKPNQFNFKPHINPQLKPKLNQKGNARIKREVENRKVETEQKETKIEENVRHKRDIKLELETDVNKQPRGETKSSDAQIETDRKKRQIVYFINRPAQQLARAPRTTPNPFVRETHIEDYDIIRPEVGEREGMIPTVESGSEDPGSYPLVNEESTEFSKIITQFYLTASEEYWPEIRHFADNILSPLSRMSVKKEKLLKALKSVEEHLVKTVEDPDVVESYEKPPMNEDINEVSHNRVKRRVNKTLQRKRAKKKKQRLRRFERKRLRMLTHARRVRRQQKSKQARLQRHYARMNMTTPTPGILGNNTKIGEDEDLDEDHDDESQTKSGDEEDEEEEDAEYESSEYEDESEASESTSESERKTSKESRKDSEESDSDTEESSIGGKPDYGNSDYEEYEDDSDEDYEDSSKEESDRKKKKSGKGKKLEVATKSGKKHSLHMLKRSEHIQDQIQRKSQKNINFNKVNSHFLKGRESVKVNNKQNYDSDLKRNIGSGLDKQTSLHNGRQKINYQYLKVNVANKHLKVQRVGLPK